MERSGVDAQGIKIMEPKSRFEVIELRPLRSAQAQIIKQKLLSLGADAAVSKESLVKNCDTACILFANRAQINRMLSDLRCQPFRLADVACRIRRSLTAHEQTAYTLRLKKRTIVIRRPLIMGILNSTPDSFSGDGLLKQPGSLDEKALVERVAGMVRDGMDILDVGGESSRPGAPSVPVKEEMRRVIPVLKTIRKAFQQLIVSLDTCKAAVADRSIKEAAVDIINDISALRMDKKMHDVVRTSGVGLILMHMRGVPRTMQRRPRYDDVCADILSFLTERYAWACQKGINPQSIIVDPGIGFGKTVEHNMEILRYLSEFKVLGRPILTGTSRKSFIGHILRQPNPQERETGTACSCMMSLAGGARIVRVHNVRQAKEVRDFYTYDHS